MQRTQLDNIPNIADAFNSSIAKEPVSHTPPVQKGIDLSYQGHQFSKSDFKVSPDADETAEFQEIFGSVGGIVIRYDLGYRQSGALLQQTTLRDNVYRDSPIEKAGRGNDQSNLFDAGDDKSSVYRDSLKLLQASHFIIGKNKVMNDRGQPVAAMNKKDFSGQQAIWGILHSAVWNIGIGLPRALDDQGFKYIALPEGITPLERIKLSQDVKAGNYTIDSDGNAQFYNPELLLTTLPFSSLETDVVDPSPYNSVMTVKDKHSREADAVPAGYILDKNNQIISEYYADALLKTMHIAKGGFNGLTPGQQKALTSGLISDNTASGKGLFQQNNVFNALVPVFKVLEENTGFSVAPAIKKNITQTGKRLVEAIKKDNAKEAFLSGPILNEMVQPLKAKGNDGRRSPIPERFKSSLDVNSNTSKALAYAFDLKDKSGNNLLKVDDEAPFENNPSLKDVQINGELQTPELSEPRYVASMLATSVLVAEQVIIDRMLTAIAKGDHSLLPDLKVIFGNDTAEQLMILAHDIPMEKLGRQFSETDPLIQVIRDNLDTKSLIEYVDLLNKNGHSDVQPHMLEAVEKLERVGDILNENPETTARQHGSRGINAGLSLVADYMKDRLVKQRFSLFSAR